MYLEKNEIIFGNYIIRVEKEPVVFYTGYSDWIRNFIIMNRSKDVLLSFKLSDVDSQVLSTGLYMFYFDSCFSNDDINYDPNFGNDIVLDFDLLSILNPSVCGNYDIEDLINSYCGFGLVTLDISLVNTTMERYSLVLNGHNKDLIFRIYQCDMHFNKKGYFELETADMEEIYRLSQLVNDDLNSLVTNFIQNNL